MEPSTSCLHVDELYEWPDWPPVDLEHMVEESTVGTWMSELPNLAGSGMTAIPMHHSPRAGKPFRLPWLASMECGLGLLKP